MNLLCVFLKMMTLLKGMVLLLGIIIFFKLYFIYSSMALSLIIYLRMNRVDLAVKEFRKLREKDEDATLTQMAQAWLNLALVRKLKLLKK